jgi:hypothetical protein
MANPEIDNYVKPKEKMNRQQYLDAFKDMTTQMLDLTTRKNNDYGGVSDPFKNFREFGVQGILVRISDKWARIKTALQEGRELQVKDEVIEDTIFDLAVYCVILRIVRQAQKDGTY